MVLNYCLLNARYGYLPRQYYEYCSRMYYDSCETRCRRCLSSVPGPSMSAWVLLTMAVSACGGALMIGVDRTRVLLAGGQDEFVYKYSYPICLGIIFGMVFFGVVFVIIATLSSYPMSSIVFDSTTRNLCAQAINITLIVVWILLQLVWIAITIVLTVPVALFTLLIVLINVMEVTRINLKNYALTRQDHILDGQTLNKFYEDSHEVFVCYLIAFVASLLVVLCITFFNMCAAANIAHLRENKYGIMDIYKDNDVGQSKNSVLDTRM